jgi:hypothetical protein
VRDAVLCGLLVCGRDDYQEGGRRFRDLFTGQDVAEILHSARWKEGGEYHCAALKYWFRLMEREASGQLT